MSRTLHTILLCVGLALLTFLLAGFMQPPVPTTVYSAGVQETKHVDAGETKVAALHGLSVTKLEVGRDYLAYYNGINDDSLRAQVELDDDTGVLENMTGSIGSLVLRTSNNKYIGTVKVSYKGSYIACNPKIAYSVRGSILESESIIPLMQLAEGDYVTGDLLLRTSTGDRMLPLPTSRIIAWR